MSLFAREPDSLKVRRISVQGVRVDSGERADFGTSVAAAFIDIDVPSTTNSVSNSTSTLTSGGGTAAATTTTT